MSGSLASVKHSPGHRQTAYIGHCESRFAAYLVVAVANIADIYDYPLVRQPHFAL